MKQIPENDPHDDPGTEVIREQIDAVERELVDVLARHASTVSHRLLTHAMIEATGRVCIAMMTLDPSMRVETDRKLDLMRLFVATEGQRPQ